MKPQNLHAQEDRLLDFVYGELPPTEAQAVETHVEGCPRCSELLADIRGVRTTMAQLPMEPAPDAGLESLLAYAQQAARNAAAGPAPKPSWWRRWMLPVVGVAAVCTFGIISIQVSKSVELRPELSGKGQVVSETSAAKAEAKAPAAPEKPTAAEPAPVAQVAPAPMPSTPAANAAPAKTEELAAAEGAAVQGPSARDSVSTTPPTSYPAAKLDDSLLGKAEPRKKAFVSGTKAPSADWSNAGTGGGFAHSKEAKQELAAVEKKPADKLAKDEEYQNDAMTQMRGITKSKTLSMGYTRGDSPAMQPAPAAAPAPTATPPAEEAPAAGADGMLAERAEPQQMQQMPSQGSPLRLNGGRTGAAQAPSKSAADAPADDFDELFASNKKAVAKREQQATRSAMPPPPPAAAAPKPSMAYGSGVGSASLSTAQSESRGRSAGSSVSELSKLAMEAFRSGNRVREAQLLAQALEAGASGSERLGLLNRLCDAQFAIGQRDAAFQTCNQVLEEGPRTGAAQMAQRRLSRESLEAEDGKARPGGARASKKAAPAELDTAPASAPVQAQ